MESLIQRILHLKTTKRDVELLQHATSSPEVVGKSIELSPLKFWQVKIEYARLTNRVDEEFARPILQIEYTTLRSNQRSRLISVQVAKAYVRKGIDLHITKPILAQLREAAEVEPLTLREKRKIFD